MEKLGCLPPCPRASLTWSRIFGSAPHTHRHAVWLKTLVSCCGFAVNFVPLTVNSFTGCDSRQKYTLLLLSPSEGTPQLLNHALNGSFQIIVELKMCSSPFPLLIFASHKTKCWDFIFQCTFLILLASSWAPSADDNNGSSLAVSGSWLCN